RPGVPGDQQRHRGLHRWRDRPRTVERAARRSDSRHALGCRRPRLLLQPRRQGDDRGGEARIQSSRPSRPGGSHRRLAGRRGRRFVHPNERARLPHRQQELGRAGSVSDRSMTTLAELLNRMRDVVQEDIGNRGLRTEPARNLINACPDDFRLACESLAGTAKPGIAIVTGFYIPTAQPPAGETDGPLGAVYLARALTPLRVRVALVTDVFCERALRAGLAACGLQQQVPVITLAAPIAARSMTPETYCRDVLGRVPFPLTHLLAIERVGPSHTLESLQHQMESGGALGQAYLDFL